MADDDKALSSLTTTESSRTVRLNYGSHGKRIGEIYFISTRHHIIEHRGKRYAVFVSYLHWGSPSFDAKSVELKDDCVFW